MNESGSHELGSLDSMNRSGLWVTSATLGRELRALDAMKRSRLLLTSATLGHQLRALNTLNSFGQWLT